MAGNDYVQLDFLEDFHRHVRLKFDGKTRLKSERQGYQGITKSYDRIFLVAKYINHEFSSLKLQETPLDAHQTIVANAFNNCNKDQRGSMLEVATQCFLQYNGQLEDDKFFDYALLCKNKVLERLFSTAKISSYLISIGYDHTVMWRVTIERTVNTGMRGAHLVWEPFRQRFYALLFFHDRSPFFVPEQNTIQVREYLAKKNSYKEHIINVVKEQDYDPLLGKDVELINENDSNEQIATKENTARRISFMKLWRATKTVIDTLTKEKLMKGHYLAVVCVLRYLVKQVWTETKFSEEYSVPTRKAHKQQIKQNNDTIVHQWQFESLLAALCFPEPNEIEMHIKNCATDDISNLDNVAPTQNNKDMKTHLIGDNGLRLLAQFQVGLLHLQLSNEFLRFPLGETVVTKAALMFSGNTYLAMHKAASTHYTEKGFDDKTVCSLLLKTESRKKRFNVLRSCILYD